MESKSIIDEAVALEINTSPLRPQLEVPPVHANSGDRKESGKKQCRQHRRNLNKKIKELEQKLKETQKSKNKYKKRYERLKDTRKSVSTPSPGTNTIKLLGKKALPVEVKRKLLFAEVMACVSCFTIQKYQFNQTQKDVLKKHGN
uniref:Uncharacterized protein n=1 Tax=Clastoptera arizonana TaxID=38151 RepID=A0A1B6EB87_9HEMI